MITAEQIPDEAARILGKDEDGTLDRAKAAIAAVLAAWPNKLQTHNHDGLIVMRPAIVLPIEVSP